MMEEPTVWIVVLVIFFIIILLGMAIVYHKVDSPIQALKNLLGMGK